MLIIWFLSLIFCEGYYKAAALTTDKLLQEHQEVNVSKLCLFYPLMTGVPNGYQVPISTVILGGKLWEARMLDSRLRGPGSSLGQWHCAVFLGETLSMALRCVLGRDTVNGIALCSWARHCQWHCTVFLGETLSMALHCVLGRDAVNGIALCSWARHCQWHCAVFLGETLYSHSAYLHPGL